MLIANTAVYIIPAVPQVLKETLPVVSKSIEEELSASQSLAWKYTAAQEKLTNSDSQPEERDAPAVSLKQALSNVRQHEVFLKMLLVRYPWLVFIVIKCNCDIFT